MANKCALCGKIDVLHQYDFTSKHIQTSFFSVNKKQFLEDFVKYMDLCIICAQKILLSTSIKKDYDEMCNRNNKLSDVKCFFCEQRKNLLNLDDNPNEIHNKIDVFLNAVIIRHEWKHLKACLKCLYNLDIWFEVRNNIYKIMNIPAVPVEEATMTNNRSVSQQRSPRKVLAKLNLNKSNRNNTRKKLRPKRKQNRNKTIEWKKYLNQKFNKLQTVNELTSREDFFAIIPTGTNINDEDKLFNQLPFVNIMLNSQIAGNMNNPNNDVIVLSDTEDNSIGRNTRTSKRKLVLQLKSPVSLIDEEKAVIQTRTSSRKNTNNIKPPLPNSFELTNSLEGNSDSSESINTISSNEQDTYVCNICDKTFSLKCEYLQHTFKHENFQELVVKVSRQNLPQNISVSEILSQSSEENSLTNISTLLSKWIGENAAAECRNSTNVPTFSEQENDKSNSEFEKQNNNDECEKEDDEQNDKEDNNADQADIDAENIIEHKKPEHETEDKSKPVKKTSKKLDEDDERVTEMETDGITILETLTNEHEAETNTTQSCKTVESIEKDESNEEEELEKTDNKDGDNDNENEGNEKSDEEAGTEIEKEKEGDKEIEKENEGDKEIEKEKEDDKEIEKEKEGDKEKECDKEVVDEDEVVIEEEATEEEQNSDAEEESTNKEKVNEGTDGDLSKEDSEIEAADSSSEIIDQKKTSEELTNSKGSKNDLKKSKTDDFSNSAFKEVDSIMTCEDLLSILETNIDDENNVGKTTSDDESKKRKRSGDDEITPKRKRVRFAEEKEIFSSDKTVLLEKIIENDQFSQDEQETDKDSSTEL